MSLNQILNELIQNCSDDCKVAVAMYATQHTRPAIEQWGRDQVIDELSSINIDDIKPTSPILGRYNKTNALAFCSGWNTLASVKRRYIESRLKALRASQEKQS